MADCQQFCFPTSTDLRTHAAPSGIESPCEKGYRIITISDYVSERPDSIGYGFLYTKRRCSSRSGGNAVAY